MSIFKDEYNDLRVTWWILLFVTSVAGVIAALVLIVRQIDYHYESTYCQPHLNQAGRQGKFVQYNFWEYDCLVKTKNGTYIPLSDLYNNIQENNVQK